MSSIAQNRALGLSGANLSCRKGEIEGSKNLTCRSLPDLCWYHWFLDFNHLVILVLFLIVQDFHNTWCLFDLIIQHEHLH